MYVNYFGKSHVAINSKLILLKRENCFILLAEWINLFKRFWHWMCTIHIIGVIYLEATAFCKEKILPSFSTCLDGKT